MNPNTHGAALTPEQQYQMALTYMANTGQTPTNMINRPLPGALGSGLSPQVLATLQQHHQQQQRQQQHLRPHPLPNSGQQNASPQTLASQFHPNPQVTAAVLNRLSQQNQRQISSQPPNIPSVLSNFSDQARPFLGDSSHPINSSPSQITANRPLGKYKPQQAQAFAEQTRLIATITAAKQGRLSHEHTDVLFQRLGPDFFRSAGLGHLVDPSGNLIVPSQNLSANQAASLGAQSSKPSEVDEAAIQQMKRQIHLMQQLVPRVEYLQRCLSESCFIPNESHPIARPMTSEEKIKVESELASARSAHAHLQATLQQLVAKHGGADLLAKKLPMAGSGPGTGGLMHHSHQQRPPSSNAPQSAIQQQFQHQPMLQQLHAQQQIAAQNQISPQSAQLPPAQIQHQHSSQPQLGARPVQNQPQQVFPLSHHQQQVQTPHPPTSSASYSGTPQQQSRQIPHTGAGTIPFGSPASHSGVAGQSSSSAEHLARFQNQQLHQQLSFRAGSPRQGPAQSQPPRPPSAAPPVAASGYVSSPNPNQPSPSNSSAYHQLPTSNIQNLLNSLTSDNFMHALRDSYTRKGFAWTGPPIFRGKDVDLFKLFGICVSGGGFDRLTSNGLWMHVALKMDVVSNQSDKGDVQSAAQELSELYRLYCLEFEQVFFAAVHKQHIQQEQIKIQSAKNHSHPSGQSPAQTQHQPQHTPTPQNQPTPQGQLSQPEQVTNDQRPQANLPDMSHSQQLRSHLQRDSNIISDPISGPSSQQASHIQQALHISHQQAGQPPASQPSQLQNQQAQHSSSNYGLQRDQMSQGTVSQSQPAHVDQAASAVLTGSARQGNINPISSGINQQISGPSYSNDSSVNIPEDQLRDSNMSEESLIKIRMARAQMEQKPNTQFSSPGAMTALLTQPRNASSGTQAWTGSAGNSGPSRQPPSAEDALPMANNLSVANLRPEATDVTSAKMIEAANMISQLKIDGLAQAAALFSKYKQPNPRELNVTEKEQYRAQMEQIFHIYHATMNRLPEYLILTGKIDQVRQVVIMALNFQMCYAAYKKNEYCVAQADIVHIRAKFEWAWHYLSLRMEDLKQPPSKRMKTGLGSSSTLGASPDLLQGSGGVSPSAPEISNPNTQPPAEGIGDAGSPVFTGSSKSPGAKSFMKRSTPARGGIVGRGGRKASTHGTRPTTKTSHQIMAEVKAEHAAAAAAKAKAAAQAENVTSDQFGSNSGTASDMLTESSENNRSVATPGLLLGHLNEGKVPQSNGILQPALASEVSKSVQIDSQLKADQPPDIVAEKLLKELWNDALLTGDDGNSNDNGWKSLIADLRLPTITADTIGGSDSLVGGSWLLDEQMELLTQRNDEMRDPMLGAELTSYIPPGMESLFEECSPTGQKVRDDPIVDSKPALKVGLHGTRWRPGEDVMSEFVCDPNQLLADDERKSMLGGEEKSTFSRVGTDSGRKTMNTGSGTAGETPEFSPSKLSSDSTPESVCSTDGQSHEQLKRNLNGGAAVGVEEMVHGCKSKLNHNDPGACEEDSLLMYMMGFDDESSRPMNNGEVKSDSSTSTGSSTNEVKRATGLVGLSSNSELSNSFWSRPFVTTSKIGENQINSSDEVGRPGSGVPKIVIKIGCEDTEGKTNREDNGSIPMPNSNFHVSSTLAVPPHKS
ncbi:expressed protein [Phakopsora pachyrhizi]|uniref:Expressed protein n=1 Tax=Phakopsora pachyrhizi TaxID=170000 RepID=A0AAV0BJI3_PHAPC|nr:expressed protein [Phakopsora pachyrhizi]